MAIQSIERASAILSLFSRQTPRLGIMEIAEATGLGKGTVHNIVKTLRINGFLSQDPETRKYVLGTKLFILGSIVSETLEINQKSSPPASRLAQATGLNCRVGIWDQDAALITLDITPGFSDPIALRIGPRVMAYCSAIGRAMLAFLNPEVCAAYLEHVELESFTEYTMTQKNHIKDEIEKTRKRGFALNNQELAIGRASIAVPICKAEGVLCAAISLTGSPQQIVHDRHESIAVQLRDTASEISRYMGHYS